jgi:hypothetical protein
MCLNVVPSLANFKRFFHTSHPILMPPPTLKLSPRAKGVKASKIASASSRRRSVIDALRNVVVVVSVLFLLSLFDVVDDEVHEDIEWITNTHARTNPSLLRRPTELAQKTDIDDAIGELDRFIFAMQQGRKAAEEAFKEMGGGSGSGERTKKRKKKSDGEDGDDDDDSDDSDDADDDDDSDDADDTGDNEVLNDESDDDDDDDDFPGSDTDDFKAKGTLQDVDLFAMVDEWIEDGKTRKGAFDVAGDRLFTAPILPLTEDSGKSKSQAKKAPTVVIKTEPGAAAKRWEHRAKLSEQEASAKFPPKYHELLEEWRSTRTYSHVSKYCDAERKLKELGYKQATHKVKRPPTFLGYDGEACPKTFGSEQISFCTQYLPAYREQEQQTFLYLFQRAYRTKKSLSLDVEDFFPLTWRLYKMAERRNLKARTTNETLKLEGGPYVTKFTFSHGAGKPSLTVKMWDKIKKSDHSTKQQVQEAKQKMIVQRYINHPYLFQNRKFVVRTFAIILNNKPMVVLYHDGAILRSLPSYSPFVRRDGNYKSAAHFTNAQSTHKGKMRSSELYASLGQFQQWLQGRNREHANFLDEQLRPRLKSRMLYALYALLRPPKEVQGERADVKKSTKLPSDVVVVQSVCFDFLLDQDKNLWLLGVQTAYCAVNLGGDAFRPPWKQALQSALGDTPVRLGEELLFVFYFFIVAGAVDS